MPFSPELWAYHVAAIVLAALEPLHARAFSEMPRLRHLRTRRNARLARALREAPPFLPPAWGAGPLAQTVLGRFVRPAVPPYEKVETLVLADGGHARLLWRGMHLPPAAPLMVINHGMVGGGASAHMAAAADSAVRQGWRAVAVVRRGQELGMRACGVKRCRGYPMHCDMGDVREVLGAINARFPAAPLLVAGSSAGGNVAVMVGALGRAELRRLNVAACFSCACGYDIHRFVRGLWRRPMSDALMTSSLMDLHARRAGSPGCQEHGLRPAHELMACTSVREVEALTALRGKGGVGCIGAARLRDYYDVVSCKRVLDDVAVPTLLLNSKDDVLVTRDLMSIGARAAARNPNIIFASTAQGGHAGWVARGGGFWDHELCVAFFSAVLAGGRQRKARVAGVKRCGLR